MADQDQPTPTTEERPEQNVTVEDAGPARKKLTIEVPESRIKDKIESTYQQLRDDAAIPGFRRGRAPQRLIEKRFGDSIRQDVKGQILSEAYTQAVEDEKLDVLGEPDVQDVENIELPESGPLKFEVEVEVTPEFTLPAFEELAVEKPSAEVTDEDLDQELEQLKERFGQMKQVDDSDAAVEANEYIQADVTWLEGEDAGDDAPVITDCPGTYISVPGESRDFRGHVEGVIVDDLGHQLIGKKPGEVVSISMTGPSNHEDERIKDKPVTIRIAIKAIERVEPATLEQVVERAGVENEDELKDRVREMLQEQKQREQQQAMHRQVIDQLDERTELELPEGLTGRQTQRVLRRRAMDLAYQGMPPQQIEEQIAEMRSGSEEEARKQLKQFFILDKAAHDLEVEVSEGEVNGRVAMLAMQQGRRPEKLRQELQSRGELEQIYLQIREQKTMDQILEKAKVTEAEGESEAKPKSGGGKKKKKSK